MAVLKFPSSQCVRRSGVRLLCSLTLLLASSTTAQTPNLEYRIKAAYIFNFAKFVSWPANAFARAESPIVIGIVGKDPFGEEIDQTIAGKFIEKRPLQVKRLAENESLQGYHILFIGDSERQRLPQILQQARKLSILTVGEMDDFTELGGMIRFFKHENNIRFEVDLDPVEVAGLKISSKLLQVAIVKGKLRK
jgi:uncharacterized protein DUF4154